MDIILFILVLGLIILIHEFGHFYFARKANILCHEFAIGMGPVIYQKKKGETLYAIRAIPLGGFVSMAGEELADHIRVGDNVGIVVDENVVVTEIVLNNESSYNHLGTVVDFDLYGADNKDLFIKLLVSGEEKQFLVSRTANFILSPKKSIQIGPAERSYESKTLSQRFLVVFAGPAANFILAFLILFVVALFVGKPLKKPIVGQSENGLIKAGDVITSINGHNISEYKEIPKYLTLGNSDVAIITIEGQNDPLEIPLTVVFQGLGFVKKDGANQLIVGSAGGASTLIKDDLITGIYFDNNKGLTNVSYVAVSTWEELINEVNNNKEVANVYLEVFRNGETKHLAYNNLKASTLNKLNSEHIIYQIGIAQKTEFNILYPFYYPFLQIGSDMGQMLNTIGLLFNPKSGVGVGDLAGPIGIFTLVSQARENGIIMFMVFVAFLSVNIGFLNLLPIPALDGGRIAFIIYEAITRKKVNKKFENTLIFITFILLLTLMVFVTYNDIARIVRNLIK